MGKKLKQFINLAIAIGSFSLIFFYLSETLLYWRFIFSGLMFLATYIMIDGFLKYR